MSAAIVASQPWSSHRGRALPPRVLIAAIFVIIGTVLVGCVRQVPNEISPEVKEAFSLADLGRSDAALAAIGSANRSGIDGEAAALLRACLTHLLPSDRGGDPAWHVLAAFEADKTTERPVERFRQAWCRAGSPDLTLSPLLPRDRPSLPFKPVSPTAGADPMADFVRSVAVDFYAAADDGRDPWSTVSSELANAARGNIDAEDRAVRTLAMDVLFKAVVGGAEDFRAEFIRAVRASEIAEPDNARALILELASRSGPLDQLEVSLLERAARKPSFSYPFEEIFVRGTSYWSSTNQYTPELLGFATAQTRPSEILLLIKRADVSQDHRQEVAASLRRLSNLVYGRHVVDRFAAARLTQAARRLEGRDADRTAFEAATRLKDLAERLPIARWPSPEIAADHLREIAHDEVASIERWSCK